MRRLVAFLTVILGSTLPFGWGVVTCGPALLAQEIAPYRVPSGDTEPTNDETEEPNAAAAAASEFELILDTVNGTLELLSNDGWAGAGPGTVLRPDDIVRVSGATELHFRGYNEPVYLFRRGTYRVGDAYSANQLHRGLDIRSIGGAAGFRFPPAVAELLQEYGIEPQGVFDMLEHGYGGLMAELQDSPLAALLGLSVPVTEELVGLIEVWSSVLRQQIGEAIERLESMRSRPGAPFYHEQTVLHATLLIESFAYADALELLRGYVRTIDREDTASLQRAYLLTALAFHGLGNRGAAHMYLRQTRELDPASSMGDTASELLASL